MSHDLPKAYDPASVESAAYRAWTEARAFHAEPTDPGDPYSIVIPPPNVTAALHLGHALNNTLQDILIRWRRMVGDNAVWLPGTDHAGIATQTVVEKRVLQEEGKRRTDFARDEFVKKIQAWKDEYEARITDQLKRMGCSCDWDRQAFTMDEQRAKAVREAFFRLFKDGLIYRGKRLVNWDPVTQTALADDEVEMEEVDGHFYYLRYPLVEETGGGQQSAGGEELKYVTVATTRPETMLGDTAVAINPRDPRAAALRGRKVRLPIVNRIIPIIEDDYVVLPVSMGGDENDPKAQFATGFLKVTPAHDPNDYDIGQRHGLPMINVMAPDASISDKHGWSDIGEAGFLLGKSREEARKLIVDWFKQHGLLEDVKPYRHSVGHSYRSHVPIEPYLSDQWYCKVTDDRLAGAALRAMAPDQVDKSGAGVPPASNRGQNATESEAGWEGLLRFYPARYAKTFQTWHENIRDWCISRQLWWGHRIPVWSRPGGSLSELESRYGDAIRSQRLWAIEQQGTLYVCVQSEADRDIVAELERQGFTQDPDVLDTWFSSALWPLSTLGWPDESAIRDPQSAINTWNPTSVLCTAREIITLWVSRMVMFNLYFLNRLPFRDVFVHAMIQDGHGQKMSKSLGNGVDPTDIIHTHGADAMRFTLASMATNTQDVRMPVDMVDPHSGQTFTPRYITDSAGYTVAAPIQESPKDPKKKMVSSYGYASGKAMPTDDMPLARNTSSKFDLGRNFCNKLWNAARFVIQQAAGDRQQAASASQQPAVGTLQSLADRWIVSRFARAVASAEQGLRDYRFDQYAQACYDFFWRDYCDWYVEASKAAMRDPSRAPQTAQVLATVLDAALRLMHPAIPFITETIWWRLNEVVPQRGIPGVLDAPSSELLIKAAWPQAPAVDEQAERDFATLQEIVGTIRNVRNEYKADPKKPVPVSISAPAELAKLLLDNREILDLLATCKLVDARPDLPAPANAARAIAGSAEIYVEGLIDPEAEKQRLAKKRQELENRINAMKARLANESYIAKAPPHLVQQTRDQLAQAEAELARLG